MTRADLVASMAAESGWTKAASDRALRALLASIRTSLKRGVETVQVRCAIPSPSGRATVFTVKRFFGYFDIQDPRGYRISLWR